MASSGQPRISRRIVLQRAPLVSGSFALTRALLGGADWMPRLPFAPQEVAASIVGQRVFPADNPWNTDISQYAVDPNSDALIRSIGLTTALHPDFGTVYNGAPNGIPYTVVPGTQARVPVTFTEFGDQSDPGPYPIPPGAPIEGGPNATDDRHVLVIDADHGILYELYHAFPNEDGSWNAGSGAIFDLNSNVLRPEGWTSADAAGLPIFPGLVRYDEVVLAGLVQHAFRFTVQHTRRAYVSPARHFASSSTNPDFPPMGMRVRLKASVALGGFTPNLQVILRVMKTYGMFVADNGSNWFISGAPDPRWNDDELVSGFRRLHGSDFEVVGAPNTVPVNPVPTLSGHHVDTAPVNHPPMPAIIARGANNGNASSGVIAPLPLPRR